MKPILRQFCTLLAATNIDQRQIRELLSLVNKTPNQILYAEIDEIRRQFSSEPRKIYSTTEQTSDDLLNKIIDLIINQAKLKKSDAHLYFGDGLRATFPDRVLPPFSSKAGFLAWIRSLRKIYSDSELLHIATRLRNDRVNNLDVKDDWLHRS